MIDWLNTSVAYWHWLVIGMLLLGGEIFLNGFILFWFGISALVVACAMLFFTIPFEQQLLLFGLCALLSLVAWFVLIRPKWKDKTLAGLGKEALTGQVGMVIESNQGKTRGRLRFPAPILGEDEWIFICDSEIAMGERVKVYDISGNSLMVRPLNENTPAPTHLS
ncbi:MAG: NfeD family protein [Pseudomonadales bacterium]|nr:NfeD family protein [Pseudomonadales bacterium]